MADVAASAAPIKYKAPNATPSSVGNQIYTDVYEKQALIDLVKEQYFGQLSGTMNMPKHFGKTIKKFHWIPLLDDRNMNDQGIDASGASYVNGNLYGSSKDVGKIQGKMPTLTEVGGRVNRVGFTRKILEGSISRMGFFYEFTEDALNFDNEAQLLEHLSRESLRGANEITEDQLQIELLNGAGVSIYTGAATSKATVGATVTGSTVTAASQITYKDLQRLAVTLNENRCPMSTKVITGSTMVDTRTVSNARVMFIGSELENHFRNMVDAFNNPAFIPVQQYGAAAQTLNGEIGAISSFRIVVVPEMMHFQGAGATASADAKALFRAGVPEGGSGDKFNVYPVMVVGSEAFTNIGFQTAGSKKWDIRTKMPGMETMDRSDPYGLTGLSSIQWWYGTLIERPEWIAVMYSIAEV